MRKNREKNIFYYVLSTSGNEIWIDVRRWPFKKPGRRRNAMLKYRQWMVKVRQGKVVPKHHAVKTYRGSGGIAPRILILGIRWSWAVSFTSRSLYLQGKSPWYPLDRRLGGPQNRSGRGNERNLYRYSCRESIPGRRACTGSTDHAIRDYTDVWTQPWDPLAQCFTFSCTKGTILREN
jgi:hypothetical protein